MPDRPPASGSTSFAELGTRIRQARLARGLTQAQLASLLGITRSAVAQWETGRAGQESQMLPRLAGALGTSPGWLVNGEDPPRLPSVGLERQAGTADELALLRLYRSCAADDRALLLRTAHRLARSAPPGRPEPSQVGLPDREP